MKVSLVTSVVVMVLGAISGGAFGLWWVHSSGEAICQRLQDDCGEWAMPMDDCLQGRQEDLLRHGLRATRRVRACISDAPRDCLAVTACIAAVEN